MEKIKISVIIPAWNAQKYLPECVAALRCQTLDADLQIILADDGSSDNTVSLARSLGLEVIRLNHGGAAHARNAALKITNAPYIYFLDSDDVPTEDALETLMTPLLKDCQLGAVFSKARDFVSPELAEDQNSNLRARPVPYGGVLPGCAMIRAEIFKAIGCFDEKLSSGETIAWMMKLRDAGVKNLQLEMVTLNRRIHRNNTGVRDPKGEATNYAAILRARMRRDLSAKKAGDTP